MAEEGKTAKHASVNKADPDAVKRRERITLILFLVGAVLIVAGMFILSQFLSGGKLPWD